MAPLSSFFTIALLALGGVNAKRKDKVSYSRYIAGDCNGHPLSGDIDDLRLLGGTSECKHIKGQSVRFHVHKKNKYNKWIDDVNSGKYQCGATLYQDVGCLPQNIIVQAVLPKDFNECNPFHAGAGSIQFWCHPNYGYQGIAQVQEIELPVTSYSIDKDGKAHPSVYTTVINATQHVHELLPDFTGIDQVTAAATEVPGIPNPIAQAEKTMAVDMPRVNARDEHESETALEPRGEYNYKGVWMKHPFVGSDICFICWTKKRSDFKKFECRSGNYNKYLIDCGPKPAPVAPTVFTDVTHIRTVDIFKTESDYFPFPTEVDYFPFPPFPTAGAEKRRSPHKAVVLHHPYIAGREVCADAEWENSGKAKAEVRIQKTKDIGKCAGKSPIHIDIGIPEQTQTFHETATASITHTIRPTYVVPPHVERPYAEDPIATATEFITVFVPQPVSTEYETKTVTVFVPQPASYAYTTTITYPPSATSQTWIVPGSTTVMTITHPPSPTIATWLVSGTTSTVTFAHPPSPTTKTLYFPGSTTTATITRPLPLGPYPGPYGPYPPQ